MSQSLSGHIYEPVAASLSHVPASDVLRTRHFKLDFHTGLPHWHTLKIDLMARTALNTFRNRTALLAALSLAAGLALTPQSAIADPLGTAITYQSQLKNNGTPFTGQPNTEVSWQVSGVRHDAWAKINPCTIEVEKTGADKGKFLTPEAFASPTANAINLFSGRERIRYHFEFCAPSLKRRVLSRELLVAACKISAISRRHATLEE